jgi:hypothetical protein
METSRINDFIVNKIYLLRGQKAMLDRDLAQLYQVETKALNQQVKRNIERFPESFSFVMTEEETKYLRSHFATANISPKARVMPRVIGFKSQNNRY